MASSTARRFSSSLGSAAWARSRRLCHRRLCRVVVCERNDHRLLTGLLTLLMHGAKTAAGCMALCITMIMLSFYSWAEARRCFGSRQGICT